MNKEVERRRKQIEMRKKERLKEVNTNSSNKENHTLFVTESQEQKEPSILSLSDEERYGYEKIMSYDGTKQEKKTPLKLDNILLKLLVSACLFLSVAILYQNDTPAFEKARLFVSTQMTEGFEYMQVITWYENTLGDPLAFLPLSFLDKKKIELVDTNYALPASGQIVEQFQTNGQRITIETLADNSVISLQDGLVIFAGHKEGFGRTIIVKNTDQSETWYGNLSQMDITLLSRVAKGERIGLAEKKDTNKGHFYLAVKQDGSFINPLQVISFE